jgi:hypothetical protein
MRMRSLAIVVLLALNGYANAQTAGGTSGPAGSSLGATPNPGLLLSPSPGLGTGTSVPGTFTPSPQTDAFTTGSSPVSGMIAPQVAGAPNTSTPGIIGIGASPSGLPGDSRAHPGFPAGAHHSER